MTLKDIAIFKMFIANKDLRKPFIQVYNKSKQFAKLPANIEEYFSNVDPVAVISKAARVCTPNSAYGYDFWQELNEEWKAYFIKMQPSKFYHDMTGIETLSGYFNILRENWSNRDKPWRFEAVDTALVRLGLADEESKPDPCENDAEIQDAPFDEEDNELDIEFVKIDKTTRIFGGLRSGIISVNTRSHSWKVAVNRTDTKYLKKKLVSYAMVGRTKSGDVVIQFNNNCNGIPIIYNADEYYHINSRQFVENLKRLLDITDDLSYLRIEKVSEKMDSITYKVTKQ